MALSSNTTTRKIILLTTFIAVGILALKYLLPFISSPAFKTWIESLGPTGPLVIIAYTALSHVAAPLVGTPAMLVSFALYGPAWTMLYLYLGSMISAAIAFKLSRKYGRALLEKKLEAESLKQVDDIVEHFGTRMLIIFRLFGQTLFEIVSYASGLTTISFRRYMVVTAVSAIPPNLLSAYLFRDLDFSQGMPHAFWVAYLFISGTVFLFFFHRIFRMRKQQSTQK